VDRAVRRGLLEPLLIAAVVLAVYVAATPQTNQAYRHFVYIAQAFLDGRVDLQGLPGHYHDIIRVGERIYAPFPPIPAFVLMPVVAVGGEATDQGRVGQVLAAIAVAVFVAGLRRLGHGTAVRWFCGAALAFGSVLWPATAIGTTWFFAQVVVVLSVAVLVWELAGARRPVVLGIAITAAWLTRLNLIAAIPVLALLVWLRERKLRPIVMFAAVNLVGAGIYAAYNYLRFGDPVQTGYGMLSMAVVNAEAAARWGTFNLRFVPEHLHAMFLRVPEVIAHPPYLKPSPWGMSLLLTSPVILRLLHPARDRRAWGPWLVLALSLAVPMLAFFSTGWVQFGYRYSLDWWPFVLVVLADALPRRPGLVDYGLLTVGIAMNALGVYWVRALGW
jgi:hypothetical protein